MKTLLLSILILAIGTGIYFYTNAQASVQEAGGISGESPFYGLTAESINGDEIRMEDYKGKVILIVNTASKCGLTPQYEGLEKLYKSHKERGFEVLGFPCNQFSNQEPGSNEEIAEFCSVNYGVSFQMFAKIDVNGENTHPVFKFLKSEKGGTFGDDIKWNFTKFLIDQEGRVVKRYAPTAKPDSIAEDIEALLSK